MGACLYLRTHLTQYVPIYDLTVIDCGSWSQCVYDWCPLQSSDRGPACQVLLEHLLRIWKIMKCEFCALLIHQRNPPLISLFT